MSKNILFVTPGLGVGGAERQLALLTAEMSIRGHKTTIICLSSLPEKLNRNKLHSSSVHTFTLRKSPKFLIDLYRLVIAAKKLQPDIIQGWMYLGNILATIIALFLRKPLFHSLRASNMDARRYWWQMKLNLLLSPAANKIVSNSLSGKHFHSAFGFKKEEIYVIENATDVSYFKPDFKARIKQRIKMGIPKKKSVILYVARLDPMKAHDVVIKLANALPEIAFIFSGKGTDNLKLPSNAVGLGIVDDMPALYNSSDLLVNFSYFGEGFPNVICEALACGTPVLANDIGDTRRIVGDEFTVNDLKISDLVVKIKSIFGDANIKKKTSDLREQILRSKNIRSMVDKYEKLYVSD